MNGKIVAVVVLMLAALPRADAAGQEVSDAISRIDATQRLLDSFIYDRTVGTIENIDPTRNTFEVEGKTFSASPANTVGAKLSELREGDKVTVQATDIEAGKEPINVMILKKAE
jgi:hypothetical protein